MNAGHQKIARNQCAILPKEAGNHGRIGVNTNAYGVPAECKQFDADVVVAHGAENGHPKGVRI